MNTRSCLLFALMLITLLVQQITSIRKESFTYDEFWHLRYGMKVLSYHPDRPMKFLDTELPVSAINAAFYSLLTAINNRVHLRPVVPSETARYPTMLFSLALALVVFTWSRKLYGIRAAFLSLGLFIFCPNLIAHSRYITTDLPLAAMVTITLYYLWCWQAETSTAARNRSALALAASQLVKYSALLLYPIILLILFLQERRRQLVCPPVTLGAAPPRAVPLRVILQTGLSFVAISIFVINIGFFGYRTATPLADYSLASPLFLAIRSQASFLSHIPIPLPQPYVYGIDLLLAHGLPRINSGNNYLLGELRSNRGFNDYFLVCFLYKVPLAIQVILIWSIVAYVRNRNRFHFWRDELVLLVPIAVYLLYFDVFVEKQIGFRYVLMILPLLYIFCGSLLKDDMAVSRLTSAGLVLLGAWLVISVASYYPHYLSYVNELIPNRTMAYTKLADSNLDWNQNRRYLQEFLDQHPQAVFEPREPVAGTIVVSVNQLTGIFNAERFRWLRDNFKPVSHIAYSYLVFQISEAELRSIVRPPAPVQP